MHSQYIIHRIVTIAQYVLTALLVVIVSEMVLTSVYSTVLVALIVSISYTLAIILLGLLAKRFFSWFRANRNSVVLLYGLSSAMLAINSIYLSDASYTFDSKLVCVLMFKKFREVYGGDIL